MESKLNDVYQNKYRIPLEHEILKDGVFFSSALSDEFLFELRLAPASNVVIGYDKGQLAYEFANIQLEYEFIHSQELLMGPCLTKQMERDSCASTSLISRQSQKIGDQTRSLMRASMFQGVQ